MGKPESKRHLGRPRRRWEDNIKLYLEVSCDPGEWIDLAEDRDLCKGGDEPPGSLKANWLLKRIQRNLFCGRAT